MSLLVAALLVAVAAAGVPDGELHDIEQLVVRLGRTRWTDGNRVRLVADPQDAYAARIELVGEARHHILISTFAWHDDRFGRALRDRLVEVLPARRRLDPDFSLCCLTDATSIVPFAVSFRHLRAVGGEVRAFNRATWATSPFYEGRLHDKMLIVDGRKALVSGRNFADVYFDPERNWLDLDIELEGEAVADLQAKFFKAWELARYLARPARFFQSEERLRRIVRAFWDTGRFPSGASQLEQTAGAAFFPPVERHEEGARVAVLYDNCLVWPRAATMDLLVGVVGRAEREVDLVTPFPNLVTELTDALAAAAARGVRVRLLANARATALRDGLLWQAGVPTLIRLAEAGVEVWLWEGLPRSPDGRQGQLPLAIHAKAVRVDDRLTIVHSSNFNYRSTFYNTEAGVAVLDRKLDVELRNLVDRLLGTGPAHGVGPPEIAELRGELGDRQRFLDSMSVLW